MTILSARTIASRKILYPCYDRSTDFGMTYGLGPCGYDVRVEFDSLGRQDQMLLPMHGYVLASTLERFEMPNDVVGIVHDKSSWARRGVVVQNTVIEPGWAGYLTLEISNHSEQDVILYRGMPIAQILFHSLDAPTDRPYDGRYQNQPRGPQRAK